MILEARNWHSFGCRGFSFWSSFPCLLLPIESIEHWGLLWIRFLSSRPRSRSIGLFAFLGHSRFVWSWVKSRTRTSNSSCTWVWSLFALLNCAFGTLVQTGANVRVFTWLSRVGIDSSLRQVSWGRPCFVGARSEPSFVDGGISLFWLIETRVGVPCSSYLLSLTWVASDVLCILLSAFEAWSRSSTSSSWAICSMSVSPCLCILHVSWDRATSGTRLSLIGKRASSFPRVISDSWIRPVVLILSWSSIIVVCAWWVPESFPDGGSSLYSSPSLDRIQFSLSLS